MQSWQKFLLYLTLAISGFAIMVFELTMPRLLAPYLGTSTYVWTIVIGVVMTSLSLGYWLGGRLADKRPYISTLCILYLTAGLVALSVYLCKDVLLTKNISGNILSSTFSNSLLLLTPLSLVLGMIPPLTLRLLSDRVVNAGKMAGNVSAVAGLGSILGTFATGLWLLPHFGINSLLLGVAVALCLSALLLAPTTCQKTIVLFVLCLTLASYSLESPKKTFARYFERRYAVNLVADLNTQYGRVWIYDQYVKSGSPVRIMSDAQSSLVYNQPVKATIENPGNYHSVFATFTIYHPSPEKVLLIGGGAYVFAQYLLEQYPTLKVDVVEIDPALLAIAQEHFRFQPTSNFRNIVVDGRSFLNTNQQSYDVIFLDAYRHSSAIPFQLVTIEAMTKLENALSERGVLFVNTISALGGSDNRFLSAVQHTMSSVFDNSEIHPVMTENTHTRQNIVLIARKNEHSQSATSNGLLLTDDYAPVEYLDFHDAL